MYSKRGKPTFIWATEETLVDIQDCLEREEHKKRCAEIEEKLNSSIKKAISYPYVNDAGKSSVYEPDFIIDGQLYEIKGDHFFNSDGRLINPYKKGKPVCLAKQRCMAEHNVTILRLVDMQEAFNYIDAIQLDITTFRHKGKKHDN